MTITNFSNLRRIRQQERKVFHSVTNILNHSLCEKVSKQIEDNFQSLKIKVCKKPYIISTHRHIITIITIAMIINTCLCHNHKKLLKGQERCIVGFLHRQLYDANMATHQYCRYSHSMTYIYTAVSPYICLHADQPAWYSCFSYTAPGRVVSPVLFQQLYTEGRSHLPICLLHHTDNQLNQSVEWQQTVP